VAGLCLILLHGFALAFIYTRDWDILPSSRRHFACEVVHTNGDSLTTARPQIDAIPKVAYWCRARRHGNWTWLTSGYEETENHQGHHLSSAEASSNPIGNWDRTMLTNKPPRLLGVEHFAHWSTWAMRSPFNRQRLLDHDVRRGIFRGFEMVSNWMPSR
jgi:hypothetical protein